jgi:enoyl-CoA hydratase/carnithine racemase
MDTDQASGIALEADRFARLCASQEMLEGTRAFLEKREPKFR